MGFGIKQTWALVLSSALTCIAFGVILTVSGRLGEVMAPVDPTGLLETM